jgi:hypothetical protein
MKKKLIFMLALMLCLVLNVYAENTVITIVPPQSSQDTSHSYFVNLLNLALKNTEKEYGKAEIKILDSSLSQGREIYEVQKDGLINLVWSGTSIEREEKLEPVRIPLVGGLLGHRVPVIRKDSLAKFERINTLEELRVYSAIQGTHWPDSDVLESANLNVNRVTLFKNMYQMLKRKRVDYFPRGLNEVYAEVEGQDELIAYDDLLIVYKFPMYFFTSKENKKLAERIDKGLRIAIKDGSFLKNMKDHPVTASMFPLSKYKNSRVIYIDNPYLPKDTPTDPELWIKLK